MYKMLCVDLLENIAYDKYTKGGMGGYFFFCLVAMAFHSSLTRAGENSNVDIALTKATSSCLSMVLGQALHLSSSSSLRR